MARLGDICEINPKANKLFPDDLRVSFIPMNKISDDGLIDTTDSRYYHEVKTGFTYFEEGDILFAKITPCMENGKGAIANSLINGIGYGSTEFHILRPELSKAISKWIYYLTRWNVFRKNCEKHMTGSAGQKRVPKAYLESYQIDLPTIADQLHIAAVLDKVSDVIRLRKQQLAKLDDLIKARFVEMFGDPILNQKGFPVYQMKDVVDFQGGSQPDKKYFEYEPTPDNIRLIQIRDYKTNNYITYIPKSMAKRFCTVDDIMIGRYGPPIFQILQGIEGAFNVALTVFIDQMTLPLIKTPSTEC